MLKNRTGLLIFSSLWKKIQVDHGLSSVGTGLFARDLVLPFISTVFLKNQDVVIEEGDPVRLRRSLL
jgi:hypothetical protein